MIQIYVESLEVYAKLNYIRDKTTRVDGEALIEEPWEEVQEEYMAEAQADLDIVMTADEVNAILKSIK